MHSPYTKVHDCDHFLQDGYIDTIKIWHEPFGNPLQLDRINGYDFFFWLSAEVRAGYKDLLDWWDSNVDIRNDHVVEYLITKAGIREADAVLA